MAVHQLWKGSPSLTDVGVKNKNCGKVRLYPQLMNSAQITKFLIHTAGTAKKMTVMSFQHINRLYYVY